MITQPLSASRPGLGSPIATGADDDQRNSIIAGVGVANAVPLRQSLAAALYTDNDSFSAPTLAATDSLLPALYSDSDSFSAPTVDVTGTVLPSLYSDIDSLLAPSITAAAAGQTLLPALVDDTDAFYAPLLTLLVLPGRFDDADACFSPVIGQILQLALLTDSDAVYATDIAIPATRTLLPVLLTDGDTFYRPSFSALAQTLLPALVSSIDTVYGPTVAVGAPGKVQKLHPARLADLDVIPAARFSMVPNLWVDTEGIPLAGVRYSNQVAAPFVPDADVIPAISLSPLLLPELLTDAEVIYRVDVTQIVQPPLDVSSPDEIPAVDVGWQVIATFTADADTILAPVTHVYNELLPDFVAEDETLDSYPFFIQQLEGGIPVPQPPGILGGTVSHPRRLTGTISRGSAGTALTGSLDGRNPRVLTGTIRHKASS